MLYADDFKIISITFSDKMERIQKLALTIIRQLNNISKAGKSEITEIIYSKKNF